MLTVIKNYKFISFNMLSFYITNKYRVIQNGVKLAISIRFDR